MQDLSFKFANFEGEFNGLRFEVRVYTFENVYGLDESECTVEESNGLYTLYCTRLTWAGGQEHVPGELALEAEAKGERTQFRIHATFTKKIRCVKLTIKGLQARHIVNLREGKREITDKGLLIKYPNGWFDLPTPLIVLENGDGSYSYVRSLDGEVREKRFALVKENGNLSVELIFEETAVRMGSEIAVPTWEVGHGNSLDEIYAEHAKTIEGNYKLLSWEDRSDVPEWFRRISLITTIHCQHFSGYIFNDYKKVQETTKWLVDYIDPERVMIYLPGWEGRYYWKYGNYVPDERMGGEQGLKDMVSSMHDHGVRVMLMFGINYVNVNLDNYEQWGAPARVLTAGGHPNAGSVDWDGSRHFDHGWGIELNPGAPSWQNMLFEQISNTIDKYDIDGVFLDISAVWKNDPRHNVYLGVRDLVSRINQRYPQVIVAGEGWYDGLSSVFPLHQSGHIEGQLTWHDVPFEPMFTKYNRAFAHLCLGDVGRGSTGVHELGFNQIQRVPLRRGIIRTLTVVDDTLKTGAKQVLEIIGDAKQYAEKYL